MYKSKIFTTIAAAAALTTSTAFSSSEMAMEKCHVVKDGKGLIKEKKGDCGTSKHSCAGQNIPNDPEAWIMVPKGQCEKINAGDFSGVGEKIKDKIEGAE